MDAEAFGAVAHRRVLEAEAGGAALRVVGVQVEITQFTPDQQQTGRPDVRASHLPHTEISCCLWTFIHHN